MYLWISMKVMVLHSTSIPAESRLNATRLANFSFIYFFLSNRFWIWYKYFVSHFLQTCSNLFTFIITIWTFLPMLIDIDTACFQIPCLLPTSILIAVFLFSLDVWSILSVLQRKGRIDFLVYSSGEKLGSVKINFVVLSFLYIYMYMVLFCLDLFCLCHRRSDLSTSLHHWGYCMIALVYPDSKVHGANMGQYGADRTQVGPILAPWTLLSGYVTLTSTKPRQSRQSENLIH